MRKCPDRQGISSVQPATPPWVILLALSIPVFTWNEAGEGRLPRRSEKKAGRGAVGFGQANYVRLSRVSRLKRRSDSSG